MTCTSKFKLGSSNGLMYVRPFLFSILVAVTAVVPPRVALGQDTLQLVVGNDCAVDGLFFATFMTGPFGGVGGYLRGANGQLSYDVALEPSRKLPELKNGRASTLRVIAYCPSHQIVTLELLDLAHLTSNSVNLVFDKLPVRRSKCYVNFPVDIQRQSFELVAYYLAFSSHGFFGIADGAVTQFEVGRATVPADGRFELALPDFSRDGFSTDQSARNSIRFIARDPVTWNILFELIPAELPAGESFPEFLAFEVAPRR